MSKNINKANNKQPFLKMSKKSKIILVAAVALFAIVLVLLWQNFTPTKNQTTAFLQQQADKINFNGTVIYEKIQDNGCGPNPTSWLGYMPMYHTCTVSMQKYFKNSGDISADLTDAHKKMLALGFKGNYDEPGMSATGSRSYLLPSDNYSTYILGIYNPKDNVLNEDLNFFC